MHPWHNEAVNEVVFNVEEEPDGGFVANAVGQSIFTQGDTIEELRAMVLDAVRCHFEEEEMPTRIQLRFVREEIIVV
jgi:predicted RNase H-like HicB family nuclease